MALGPHPEVVIPAGASVLLLAAAVVGCVRLLRVGWIILVCGASLEVMGWVVETLFAFDYIVLEPGGIWTQVRANCWFFGRLALLAAVWLVACCTPRST